MFSRASAFFLCALPLLAAATTPASQCNTGNLQCCQSTQEPGHLSPQTVINLLNNGVDSTSITAPVGLTCTPITAIGVSGNSCTAQPVCCSNNKFNGVVALGCSPVNLSL